MSEKKRHKTMMPLSMVGMGEKVRLVQVKAGPGLRARLAAMGLIPGEQLEVVRNSLRGPLIIVVKGSRVMLGRGMTRRIMVE